MPDLDVKRKTSNDKRGGYTLIEFVIVLGLLSIVVGSVFLFLTSTLKSSNQGNIVAEVKQNGQVVLDSLDRQIRSATDVSAVGTNNDHIVLTIPGASLPLHIRCFAPVAGTSNGWIGTVSSSESDPVDAEYTEMTNRDAISGVSVSGVVSVNSCQNSMIVYPASSSSTGPPVVSINFTMSQGINAPSRQDYTASVNFQTTISLRTY